MATERTPSHAALVAAIAAAHAITSQALAALRSAMDTQAASPVYELARTNERLYEIPCGPGASGRVAIAGNATVAQHTCTAACDGFHAPGPCPVQP